jgi:DNA-directed RNA polymerase specialized sigma24 family protein
MDGFKEFVELRSGELLKTAYLLTGSSHDAEDLVQTVLLKSISHFDRIADPLPYLHRMMTNERISIWRKIGRREVLTDTMVDLAAPDGVADRATLSGLDKLPRKMRAVIVLRTWLDYSEADTAAVLGCSPGTVMVHVRSLANWTNIAVHVLTRCGTPPRCYAGHTGSHWPAWDPRPARALHRGPNVSRSPGRGQAWTSQCTLKLSYQDRSQGGPSSRLVLIRASSS